MINRTIIFDEQSLAELLCALDDVTASLETVLVAHGGSWSRADQHSRLRRIHAAQDLLDEHGYHDGDDPDERDRGRDEDH